MRRNLELKARIADLAQARAAAQRIGAAPQGFLRQCDVYFHVRRGRLKLRMTDGQPAMLIWYDRPDQTETRLSRYQLVPVDDADGMRQLLDAALGVRCIVEKQRNLFLYRNVRIHLDDVAGLGLCLEFEAVLEPADSLEEARALLERLKQDFGIREDDCIAQSYGDLLAGSAG